MHSMSEYCMPMNNNSGVVLSISMASPPNIKVWYVQSSVSCTFDPDAFDPERSNPDTIPTFSVFTNTLQVSHAV